MANNSNIINGLYHKSEYLVNCRKEKNMVMLILQANFAKTFHSIHTQLMTLMNMKRTPILPLLLIMLLLISCDRQLSKSLELAGDNRAEMEKVLEHFKHDPDPLKYKAAKFLIENMPYHYSYEGEAVEKYDSLYVEVSKDALFNRNSLFEKRMDELNFWNKSKLVVDIKNIKADYLIKAIDQACDLWNCVSWKEEYEESIFFDYVLPYRLANEQLSDWRREIEKQFPMLINDVVFSRRGVLMEAEKAESGECKECILDGASNGTAVMMTNSSSIIYRISTEKPSMHYVIFKYATMFRGAKVAIDINGESTDTISLCMSRNLETFVEKWVNKPFALRRGENTVTLRSIADTLIMDYIQLASVEPYSQSELTDFSANYYTISNANTHSCICIDAGNASLQKPITLKPLHEEDGSQIVRIDYQGYPLWSIHSVANDSADVCMEVKFGCASSLAPDSLITHASFENKAFQQWVFFPLSDGRYRIMNKFNGMYLESCKDKKTGVEYLIQKPYSNRASQKWILTPKDTRNSTSQFYRIGSAFSEAMRVYDLTHQFQYFMHNGSISPQGSTLFKAKTGKCVDETNYSLYLCRYLGIPSASDFTPNWGNRSQGHSWSVLIKPDGKSVPFYMNNMPGDTIHFFHTYKKPKVFRHRFQINRTLLEDFKYEKEVPELFQDASFIDVSDEYFTTTDVMRTIPENLTGKHIVYICVFDNKNWVPVHYGVIKNRSVTFKSMGRGILYIASTFENGMIKPFGNPFIVKENGDVQDIVADGQKLQTMKLTRKYPFLGKHDLFNSRMDGGQFQGSNDMDFSVSRTFYTHKGITNGNWYDISVNDSHSYKYLRYIGAKGSYCNINELEFYDKKGNKLQGTIIGTDGEDWAKKEKVFDGDILTGFGGNSPDGNWVGIKLIKPEQIGMIRFIGRNDGNTIEIGDSYLLSFWNDNKWESLGIQTAVANTLEFRNVPSDGLYVLRDLTKGHEERIFTYENEEQLWW